MTRFVRHFVRQAAWPALLVAALLLSGCGGGTGMIAGSEFEAQRTRADALAAQGSHLEAARLYESLAASAPSGQRFSLSVQAARAYAAAGAWEQGLRVLPAQPSAASQDRLLWAPVAAMLQLGIQRPQEALAILQQLPANPPAAVQREVLALTAQAHFALGDVITGITTMQTRGQPLTDPADLLENHRLLWQLLQTGGNAVLQAAQNPPADREIAGWLALGVVGLEAARDPANATAEFFRWQSAHPDHPANQGLLSEILAGYRGLMTYPQNLALLLPLSSPSDFERQAAIAVRDGFLAAYYEQLNGGGAQGAMNVRVYDTSAPGGVQAVYRQAVGDGANFIVGPLLRDAVDSIAAVSGNVPTLALNRLSNQQAAAPALFYQFALFPEEEAEQAALLAMQLHGGQAVAMVPNDDWGIRMLNSFRQALELAGGELLDYRLYSPAQQDFSLMINQLMQIDQSNQRGQQLGNTLGLPLQTEPQRNPEIDFLFLAAQPQQARLIRPQLHFYYAGDVPVYATSAVFNPAGGADSDLNDIIFPDAPWVLAADAGTVRLRNEVESLWPQRGSQFGRFYAMGFDAYHLVPMLFEAESSGNLPPLQGMSGQLHVDAAGRVLRTLTWAQFRNGRPALLTIPSAAREALSAAYGTVIVGARGF